MAQLLGVETLIEAWETNVLGYKGVVRVFRFFFGRLGRSPEEYVVTKNTGKSAR